MDSTEKSTVETYEGIPAGGTSTPDDTKPSSWLERTLRTTTYRPQYPRSFVGKPLLWATCFFGSLGDALFGYDQGKTFPGFICLEGKLY